MPKVSGEEAYVLKKAALVIKDLIQMGQNVVTGPSNANKLKVPRQISVDKSTQDSRVSELKMGDKPILKTC